MRPDRHHRAGFTLIELLVVMVIIGVMAAATALSIQAPKADNLDAVSQNWLLAFKSLRERAVFRGRRQGVRIAPRDFTAVQRDPGQWSPVPLKQDNLRLPEGIYIELSINGAPINIADSAEQPHIQFLSDGQISPFRLEFEAEDGRQRVFDERLIWLEQE